MKPILVSSGEPAGIGPEICLDLADSSIPVVVIGDINVIQERAKLISKPVSITEYHLDDEGISQPNTLQVLHVPNSGQVLPGQLNSAYAEYVINMLSLAVKYCNGKYFSGLVTAPVHKGVINQAGIPFSGHTEFLASQCNIKHVVMMLACPAMKVALVTTHLPLRDVAEAITFDKIKEVVLKVNGALISDFGCAKPKLAISGLNPHAGENGYLGREEIEIIEPVVKALQHSGIIIDGPFPADTMFSQQNTRIYDAFITMYHDQGLPVLKYAGFGQGVNITLGLPIIRTSVDHGTALDIAGKGIADSKSLKTAVEFAYGMAEYRK